MNLMQLRYFVCVARTRNLSRAAGELNVSQPAISRQIKLLEEELGTALISRQFRGVELTDAGRLLLDRAQSQLNSFDRIASEVRDMSFAPAGQLRVGCPASLAQHLIPKPLRQFLKRFPKVSLHVQEDISDRLARAVLSDQLDLTIASKLAPHPTLSSEFLFKERIWLFGPKTWRPPQTIPLRSLSGMPLLLTRRNNAARDLIESRILAAGLQLNLTVEIDSPQLVASLAEEGMGYAVAPQFTLLEWMKRGKLTGAPIERLSIDRVLLRRNDLAPSRAAQEFVALLRPQIALMKDRANARS